LFKILNILLKQYINNIIKECYIIIRSVNANKTRLLLVITFAKYLKKKKLKKNKQALCRIKYIEEKYIKKIELIV